MKLSLSNVYNIYQLVRCRHVADDVVAVDALCDANLKYLLCFSRLHTMRGKVAALLSLLNDEMKQSLAGEKRIRWIMARYDYANNVWAKQLEDVDVLLAMGRALNMVKIMKPEGEDVPCDMPYCMIMDTDSMLAERLQPFKQRNVRLKGWNYGYLRSKINRSVNRLP